MMNKSLKCGWTILLILWAGVVLAAGNEQKDCPDCPKMVTVPAGSFMMHDGSGGHKVTFVHPFMMASTPVTQRLWHSVMGKNPSTFRKCGPDCPVESVSWEDVQVFILRLNARTGKNYRLPSEAEWEYACRAGQDTLYCGGNDPGTVAWFAANSHHSPHPVGMKAPNAWGLYDMSGNVWEWVEDCYHEDLGKAPADGVAWSMGQVATEERECHSRVLRGGSWDNDAKELQTSSRSADDPEMQTSTVGFRLTRLQ